MQRAARNTTRDLRRANRETLLRALTFDGPMSRQKLSELTGLSTATVSTLISAMLAENLLVEAGTLESDGGRPRILVQINPARGHTFGVEVGETKIRIRLFDLQINCVAGTDHGFIRGEHTPELVAKNILAGIHSLIEETGIDEADILGIGVGVPGVVTLVDGLPVVDAPTYNWPNAPLGALLRAGTGLPVHIDNGAKSLGLAELWFGAGRGAQHMLVALIGTGTGVAIINNGALYRGLSNSAGEWGHMIVDPGGRRCRCGTRGCLEAYIGAGAVLDRYAALDPDADLDPDEEAAFTALLDLARRGNPHAVRALSEAVNWLGIGLANMINLYNPQRVLLAAWAGRLLGAAYLDEIREATRQCTMRSLFEQVAIEVGGLGPDAVAIGAAARVIDTYLATSADLPRPAAQ